MAGELWMGDSKERRSKFKPRDFQMRLPLRSRSVKSFIHRGLGSNRVKASELDEGAVANR